MSTNIFKGRDLKSFSIRLAIVFVISVIVGALYALNANGLLFNGV
jgi:hypothetical protein